jgi:hypothetical protein
VLNFDEADEAFLEEERKRNEAIAEDVVEEEIKESDPVLK